MVQHQATDGETPMVQIIAYFRIGKNLRNNAGEVRVLVHHYSDNAVAERGIDCGHALANHLHSRRVRTQR